MRKNIDNKGSADAARDEIACELGEVACALREVLDSALNAASKVASYSEEWDAIESVREFVHDWLAGRRALVKIADLLVALGVIGSAIELELGIDSAELLDPLRAMLDGPDDFEPFICLPGASKNERATISIRRPRRRRNAAAAPVHLVALAA